MVLPAQLAMAAKTVQKQRERNVVDEKARQKKRLEASLEVKIPEEVYIRLEEELALGN